MLFRKTLLYFAFCTLFLAGCIRPKPVTLVNKQFKLIKVAFGNQKYLETIVHFNQAQVEIFSFTDVKKWYVNVTIGSYVVIDNRITLPFGTFVTTCARDGYYLYEEGILKYKLLNLDGSI